MAQCSFDVHVKECLGTLILGGSLVLLHPRGLLDLHYLSKTILEHNVTFFNIIPSLLSILCDYLIEKKQFYCLSTVRTFGFLGEAIAAKTLTKLATHIDIEKVALYNLYGPAECTLTSVYHRIQIEDIQRGIIPIGQPFPNMHVRIVDEFDQPVIFNACGELLIDGIQRFPGYFTQNKENSKVFSGSFYRTNDLVRLDTKGLLYFLGRKDYQIKLHGQRIELAEIEQCILDSSSCVSACIVLKWDEDYLIAYVQSLDITEEQLCTHCSSRLPPYMLPSKFILLKQFPLNSNGKLDRKRLPAPTFSETSINTNGKFSPPGNPLEEKVHKLWCEVLQKDGQQISITSNFFSIGGHSLLFIQLYHRYQSSFRFDSQSFSITLFLRQMTIANHSQLLETIEPSQVISTAWQSVHINEAPASFAQERIILDEQFRLTSKDRIMYSVPLIYRVSSNAPSLSTSRLHRALRSVVIKHKILRTALYFDIAGILMQRIEDESLHVFTVINLNEMEDVQMKINERLQHNLIFDLQKGRVLDCCLIRHQNSLSEHDDVLLGGDILLLTLHHSVFDGASIPILFHDLMYAYDSDAALPFDHDTLQYIDYAQHERQLDMTSSQQFWHSQLLGYDLQHQLNLPFDRQRLSNSQRTGQAVLAQFTLDQNLSSSFINYASQHQLTLFQLGLATFFAFLFKLTNGETDLCIAGINANRYRPELRQLIGMFVATLPYRIQMNPHDSFEQLIKQVRHQCLSILEHSHYPLQHILADAHHQQSSTTSTSATFLETVFDFITLSSDINQLTLDGTLLEAMPFQTKDNVAKFDFMLTMIHNSSMTKNEISCLFTCSSDLFSQTTVERISKAYLCHITQIFPYDATVFECLTQARILMIDELRLDSFEGVEEVDAMNFRCLSNVSNTG